MFRLECHPSDFRKETWARAAVVQLDTLGDAGEEEGHAVVVEGGAELAHGGVDGVEDLVCILEGFYSCSSGC